MRPVAAAMVISGPAATRSAGRLAKPNIAEENAVRIGRLGRLAGIFASLLTSDEKILRSVV
jgi:hypothetical protein